MKCSIDNTTPYTAEDARTTAILLDELNEYDIPVTLIQRISEQLTPTSVYQSDIWSLQDKINKDLRGRGTNGLKLRLLTSKSENFGYNY